MNLIIVIPDNAVYQDSVCYDKLDLSKFNIPSNVRVLRFDTTENTGCLEFYPDVSGIIPPNQTIGILPYWAIQCQFAWTEVDNLKNNPPALTVEELIKKCRQDAVILLYATDWVEMPSVSDPANTPYLMNMAAFIDYRVALRKLVFNPVPTPVFPILPDTKWSS